MGVSEEIASMDRYLKVVRDELAQDVDEDKLRLRVYQSIVVTSDGMSMDELSWLISGLLMRLAKSIQID